MQLMDLVPDLRPVILAARQIVREGGVEGVGASGQPVKNSADFSRYARSWAPLMRMPFSVSALMRWKRNTATIKTMMSRLLTKGSAILAVPCSRMLSADSKTFASSRAQLTTAEVTSKDFAFVL